MPWKTICALSSLKPEEGVFVQQHGHQLAVFLHQGGPVVMDNRCPHAGGGMAAGHLRDGCAICPWHGWAFRLDTGELVATPAVRIAIYPSRITGDSVEALIPDTGPQID